jgi:hypothetical protein
MAAGSPAALLYRTERIMKHMILVLILMLAACDCSACQKDITLKLSQTHFTLDLWEHAKDSMNAVKFKIPVGCEFYDQVQIGDDVLDKNFRVGSLLISGSIGNWNLEVIAK